MLGIVCIYIAINIIIVKCDYRIKLKWILALISENWWQVFFMHFQLLASRWQHFAVSDRIDWCWSHWITLMSPGGWGAAQHSQLTCICVMALSTRRKLPFSSLVLRHSAVTWTPQNLGWDSRHCKATTLWGSSRNIFHATVLYFICCGWCVKGG